MDARVMVILLALVAVTYVASSSLVSSGPTCSQNETYDVCGTLCEPSCVFPNVKLSGCGSTCKPVHTEGCRCKPGYLRDEYAKSPNLRICLLPKDCTVTKVKG